MSRKAKLPTTWTESDWQDLHEAIESVRAKVAARHKTEPEPGSLPPCPLCRCNDPISKEHQLVEGWGVFCRNESCGLSVCRPNQQLAEESWSVRI
jgi:hypothetical protein